MALGILLGMDNPPLPNNYTLNPTNQKDPHFYLVSWKFIYIFISSNKNTQM